MNICQGTGVGAGVGLGDAVGLAAGVGLGVADGLGDGDELADGDGLADGLVDARATADEDGDGVTAESQPTTVATTNATTNRVARFMDRFPRASPEGDWAGDAQELSFPRGQDNDPDRQSSVIWPTLRTRGSTGRDIPAAATRSLLVSAN